MVLGNRLMLSARLAVTGLAALLALALAGCGDTSSRSDAREATGSKPAASVLPTAIPTPTPTPNATPAASASAAPVAITATVSVAGRTLSLSELGGRCALTVGAAAAGSEATRMALDLAAPCTVLTWRSAPATASAAPSDGKPVGDVGDAMAWRYPSAKGVTVVVVIGDSIPAAWRENRYYPDHEKRGYRCASSAQAALLPPEANAPITLSRKQNEAGVFCAEIGMDEKNFWLFAHP